ncbi:MAG: hypothetical protein QOI83_2594 [Streptomycetaceae bacterium]|jgi:hypothetical protein|nr:hypothetical protein [Streptomycetaceae bacterium]
MPLLAADAGTLPVLGGRHVAMAGAGIAPAQVTLELAGADGVIEVAGAGQGELP